MLQLLVQTCRLDWLHFFRRSGDFSFPQPVVRHLYFLLIMKAITQSMEHYAPSVLILLNDNDHARMGLGALASQLAKISTTEE